MWRGLGFPAAPVKPIRIMLGWAFRFGAPLFVEQSMSRVPWHLFQNLQPRAHLVVGALAEVSATDDGDELAVVQYVLKRLVSKQKPVGDFAAMKPMPKNSLQLWGLRRQLDVELLNKVVLPAQADSVDRRQSSDTGMRTMPVVAVHEDGQLSGSLFGVEIGAGIGPFT